MATFNVTLAPARKDGTAAVILKFAHKTYRKKLNLGFSVFPEFWEEETTKVSSRHLHFRQINQRLQLVTAAVDGVMLRHLSDDLRGEEIFDEIETTLFPERAKEKELEKSRSATLPEVMRRYAAMKKESTRLTYERTLKHVEEFCAEGASDNLDEINKAWLTAFDAYLMPSCPSPNARGLHMRNLRAVLNYALDEELTDNYPFRRFKIKTVETAKRSLSVETMHEILTCEVEDWQIIYRDMFKLSFLLMGINFADLLNMKPGDLHDGRLEFNRAKTSRLYSMKVEPEAMDIIRKYRGTNHLLSIMDTRSDYIQFIRQTNNALRKIGTCERHGLGGKKTITAICPDLSTYWARHSWATIAAGLDIPKETIAAALGHGGNTVTDIYIDFDRRKVDEANRKVIDRVLYGEPDKSEIEKKAKRTSVTSEKKKSGYARKSTSREKKQ